MECYHLTQLKQLWWIWRAEEEHDQLAAEEHNEVSCLPVAGILNLETS
jgi:hypothetical protein